MTEILSKPAVTTRDREFYHDQGYLVLRGFFSQGWLDEAASEYNLVVLDAPPLLGFAEPLQMATAVDGVIVVARAGALLRDGDPVRPVTASAEGN